MNSVEISNLSHVYHSATSGSQEALSNLNLQVANGELVSIVGPSGCGKTTLLKLASGLLTPTNGSIRVHGKTPEEARSNRELGFMFQEDVLLPWRSVIANINLPFELAGKDRYDEDVASLMHLIQLNGFERNFPRELSGGMRSRVALARAIALSPSILMLDEPFGALDEETSRDLNLELLRVWKKRTPTVLLVTHDIEHAVFVSKRVLIMSKRPGTILREVLVELPEPRDQATRYSDKFFEHVTSVRRELEAAHEKAPMRR
jgi:NitT/TauT family transport system ATP-binding protein